MYVVVIWLVKRLGPINDKYAVNHSCVLSQKMDIRCRGVGTGGGQGGEGPPNFSHDIKSALFPKAKCPHLYLEMFF